MGSVGDAMRTLPAAESTTALRQASMRATPNSVRGPALSKSRSVNIFLPKFILREKRIDFFGRDIIPAFFKSISDTLILLESNSSN